MPANRSSSADQWAYAVMERIRLHQEAEVLAKSIMDDKERKLSVTPLERDQAYHSVYRQRLARPQHQREFAERAA